MKRKGGPTSLYPPVDLRRIPVPYVIKAIDAPVAGQYLTHFDPNAHAPGRSYPTGEIAFSHSVGRALRFETFKEALAFWGQPSTVVPVRPDGAPNRPLTAFTVEIVSIDD